MTRKEILNEMLCELKAELEKYLAGSENEYFYKRVHTEKYGDIDGNYRNRTRICYGLLFNVCEVDEPVREKTVRELLEQEIISRENESFQGFGENLEILTLLMRKYRRPEDRKIFERAKNANFDCFCGYDPDNECNSKFYDSYKTDPEEYGGIEELIYLADDLDMKKYVCMLVDLFVQRDMSINDCKKLLHYSQYTGREQDRERAVTNLFELVRSAPEADDMQRLRAYEEMIGLLTEKGEAAKAFSLLCEGSAELRKFNKSSFYDSALKIMDISKDKVREVWEYAKQYADTDIAAGELAPVCYNTVNKCAELADDKEMIQKIRQLEANEE